MILVASDESSTTTMTAARTFLPGSGRSKTGAPEPAEQAWPNDAKHEQHKEHSEKEGGRRRRNACGTDHGDDDGEDGPGGDIVHGGAGDRNRAEGSLGKASFLKNAGEHGKGSDAHGDAHEERKGDKGGSGPGEFADREPARGPPQEIGDDDAGMADDHDRVRLPQQVFYLEFHADGEHEEADADLAEELEGAQGRGREDELEGMRRNPAKERGTEQDARDHFSDDRGLAEKRKSQPTPQDAPTITAICTKRRLRGLFAFCSIPEKMEEVSPRAAGCAPTAAGETAAVAGRSAANAGIGGGEPPTAIEREENAGAEEQHDNEIQPH